MKKYNAKNSKAGSSPVEATDISNMLLASRGKAIEYGAYITMKQQPGFVETMKDRYRISSRLLTNR
uniref:Uncharacterized protein n=1 Tax=Candidatus Kentrum sp. SD TaxID=2126332 RepID=A0A450YGD5_9GAMM|nr:MAG: hypothetical protein BECKSD772F_GA0070984_10632 [Candidatus Kentron sp. SD]VFK45643.1 MAG: hypothetical protein BECKSD772E_GA0070983_10582 [Candidatus Kentron sp. SD]